MTGLIGKEKFYELADDIIKKSDDAGCEIVFLRYANGLTRLANSTIHQNVYTDDTSVNIRVSRGDNIGVSTTNILTPEGLFDCLVNALEIMKTSSPLPGFPGPAPIAEYRTTDTFVESTAGWGPDDRAKIAREAIARGMEDNLTLAGAIETSIGEIAIANSNGVRAYQPLSAFNCNFVAMVGEIDDPPSGYASLTGRDVKNADFRATYDRACRKAVLAKNPIEIEPDKYDVVLESRAIGELIEWFNYISFNYMMFHDGRSPLSGKIGEKITGEHLTLIDDAYGGMMNGLPFDFEGIPRQSLPLIEKGVAKSIVYSMFAAKKEGMEPTGHGFGPGSMPSSAVPVNIRMTPGDFTLDELVGKLDRGIQVTRFHYINGYLDTRQAVMTGMTRDGAWLVENGIPKAAIKNLRFTDSMLEAWKRIDGIEKTPHLIPAWWSAVGSYEIPAVLIRDFTFTGKTSKGS
ncbi:MAG: TldD/PmbA family protein [bacterium]